MNQRMKKLREYLAKHGFGSSTPVLSAGLSPEIFRQHYYDKETLIQFCRQNNLSTQGLKNEISDRIELFLRTGEISCKKPFRKVMEPFDSQQTLTLDRRVVNYKSDPVTRAFFAKHIPGFTGFSAHVQKWLKQRLANGELFTYADVVVEHNRFLKEKSEMKLSGERKKVVHDSCQYNQFFIDYTDDPDQKPHTAIEAWQLVRNSAGDKTYKRYMEEIEKIMDLLGY